MVVMMMFDYQFLVVDFNLAVFVAGGFVAVKDLINLGFRLQRGFVISWLFTDPLDLKRIFFISVFKTKNKIKRIHLLY